MAHRKATHFGGTKSNAGTSHYSGKKSFRSKRPKRT